MEEKGGWGGVEENLSSMYAQAVRMLEPKIFQGSCDS
jgi:hypothetical protein